MTRKTLRTELHSFYVRMLKAKEILAPFYKGQNQCRVTRGDAFISTLASKRNGRVPCLQPTEIMSEILFFFTLLYAMHILIS